MESTKEKISTAQSQPLPVKPSDKVEDGVSTNEKCSIPASSANVETGNIPVDNPKSSKAPEIGSIRDLTLAGEIEVSPTIKEKLDQSEVECEILRRQVLELQKNLQDTQDFIFSSQPRLKTLTEDEATEDEARTDFNTLCGSVQELVDRKLGDALDDKSLVKEDFLPIEPAKLILSCISSSGKEGFNYSGTDEYNITAAILRFLCVEIFDRNFYSYVGDAERVFISIEKGMRNLEPRRDLITLRTWRCETYSAIANRPEFHQILQTRKHTVTSRLTEMLAMFIPREPDHHRSLFPAVRKTIVEPAFALAQKISLSVDKFSIEWPRSSGSPSEQWKYIERDFNSFECIDLTAGGKPFKTQPVGNIDHIGNITSGLVYQSVNADSYTEQKVLSKPKVLVAVTREGHGSFMEAKTHSARKPTVLGWVEERVALMERTGHTGTKPGVTRMLRRF